MEEDTVTAARETKSVPSGLVIVTVPELGA
jgi:hypothetical protein